MPAHTIRVCVLAMLMAGSAAVGSACYVESIPPPAYADGYGPMFYDGYVVYYDDVGRPYYYADGVAVWVPLESPHYARLVSHWRLYGPAYRRWYLDHGYRYRVYRSPHR